MHYRYVSPHATPRVEVDFHEGYYWFCYHLLTFFYNSSVDIAQLRTFFTRFVRMLIEKFRTKIVCSTHSPSLLEIRVGEGVR